MAYSLHIPHKKHINIVNISTHRHEKQTRKFKSTESLDSHSLSLDVDIP